ncbi:MAG: DUF697 domain-containing protein [Azospirillum sp.]|nr:DUF697 domain-containing protein [Azospirillum sp.]
MDGGREAEGSAGTAVSGRLWPDLQRIENILKDDVITSMAIGLVPAPLLDTALLIGLQIKMVDELCREYGVPFSRHHAAAAVSALVGALPVASALGLSSLIKAVPVVGTLAGGAATSLLSGAITYAQGRVLVQHFESGGTLLNFDPVRLRAQLRAEFQRGKTAVALVRDRR